MKCCSGCHRNRSDKAFAKCEASKDGLQGKCKDCQREYRESNVVNIRKGQARWREDNRQYIRNYHEAVSGPRRKKAKENEL